MSSNANAFLPNTRNLSFRAVIGFAMLGVAFPVAAQDDESVTEAAETSAEQAPVSEPVTVPQRPNPIDILITVPRGEVNPVETQACEDQADAGTISGEIIVCRQLGESGENYYSGSREAARKRYAEETAFRDDPKMPSFQPSCKQQGNPPGCVGGLGRVPPPAVFIDVEALPQAPEGSDADRIARGLPPLGEDEELSKEEIKKRREALGLPPPKYDE